MEKSYIEIYPIEIASTKIHNQLERTLEAKPKMYSKTKERYKKLACDLLDSVSIISKILQTDLLVPEDVDVPSKVSEFSELPSSYDITEDIDTKLKAVTNEWQNYNQFSCPQLSMSNKTVIKRFGEILAECAIIKTGIREADICADILHRWFKVRFNTTGTSFRYNIAKLPEWIAYIVILAGLRASEDNIQKFQDMMISWIDKSSSNNYAIPYEVYQLMKNPQPSNFTIEAVLISDALMDAAYYKLNSENLASLVHLPDNLVVPIVKGNTELHEKILTRFSKRNDLIYESKLTPYNVS